MKKAVVLPILIMYACYLFWDALIAVYTISFYPDKEPIMLSICLIRVIPGLMICTLYIIIQIKIEKKFSPNRNLLLFVSLITTIVVAALDACITALLKYYFFVSDVKLTFDMVFDAFLDWVLFFFSSSILFYFTYYFRKSVEQELQLKLTKALAKEARLMMLRYQINPHFLFNSLNTIQSVIQTNQERAKGMIGELSDFFRYTLSNNDQNFVSLKDEINAVRNYLSIQKERFGESLEITYDICSKASELEIPFFIIHPLVENVIKYGFSSGNGTLKLLIKVEDTKNGVTILVKNSGNLQGIKSSGLPEQQSTKTGIENLTKRLALLYPNNHSFSLFEKDEYVNAVVTLRGGAAQI